MNSSLSLQHVFHVPSLSTNLVFVHQLTKDLNCHVVFSPHTCVFQELDRGKMIGAADEWNGLYYLKRDCELPTGDQPILACSSHPTPTMTKVWLQHFHLGHPPFVLLKIVIPENFVSYCC